MYHWFGHIEETQLITSTASRLHDMSHLPKKRTSQALCLFILKNFDQSPQLHNFHGISKGAFTPGLFLFRFGTDHLFPTNLHISLGSFRFHAVLLWSGPKQAPSQCFPFAFTLPYHVCRLLLALFNSAMTTTATSTWVLTWYSEELKHLADLWAGEENTWCWAPNTKSVKLRKSWVDDYLSMLKDKRP